MTSRGQVFPKITYIYDTNIGSVSYILHNVYKHLQDVIIQNSQLDIRSHSASFCLNSAVTVLTVNLTRVQSIKRFYQTGSILSSNKDNPG